MKQQLTGEAKPFLKWAGGKGQLINQIREYLPAHFVNSKIIEQYFEPFVGGGAVFFWLQNFYTIKKSFLFDINPEIVNSYLTIRDSVVPLIKHLKNLEKEYQVTLEENREDLFYKYRQEFNDLGDQKKGSKVRKAALMIFLNKTCFNGLFRVNSKGQFNVPFGRYVKPRICDERNLWMVHQCLENTQIECADFANCLKDATRDSLVYFDPPYRPISKTASFTGYIKSGFHEHDQLRLKKVCDQLSKKGAKVILSNSDPKNIDPEDNFFDDLYTKKYKIERLKAARMINCQAEKRGQIKEILVMNY